ncbi:MAG: PHP domain-containing protein [Cyanobacteriota bacterium]
MVVSLEQNPCGGATAADLRRVLQGICPLSCPLHYNFHLHTRCSDGQMDPIDLAEQARQQRLQGLAITDHHTLKGYEQVRFYLDQPGDPVLWSGIEITTELLSCEVHILGYGFDPTDSTLNDFIQGEQIPGLPAGEAIQAIQAAGGLAVLAHPFRYSVPAEEVVAAAAELGVDGLEVYYAYKNSTVWVPSPGLTDLAERMATSYGLLKTCGTDSHGPSILRRV